MAADLRSLGPGIGYVDPVTLQGSHLPKGGHGTPVSRSTLNALSGFPAPHFVHTTDSNAVLDPNTPVTLVANKQTGHVVVLEDAPPDESQIDGLFEFLEAAPGEASSSDTSSLFDPTSLADFEPQQAVENPAPLRLDKDQLGTSLHDLLFEHNIVDEFGIALRSKTIHLEFKALQDQGIIKPEAELKLVSEPATSQEITVSRPILRLKKPNLKMVITPKSLASCMPEEYRSTSKQLFKALVKAKIITETGHLRLAEADLKAELQASISSEELGMFGFQSHDELRDSFYFAHFERQMIMGKAIHDDTRFVVTLSTSHLMGDQKTRSSTFSSLMAHGIIDSSGKVLISDPTELDKKLDELISDTTTGLNKVHIDSIKEAISLENDRFEGYMTRLKDQASKAYGDRFEDMLSTLKQAGLSERQLVQVFRMKQAFNPKLGTKELFDHITKGMTMIKDFSQTPPEIEKYLPYEDSHFLDLSWALTAMNRGKMFERGMVRLDNSALTQGLMAYYKAVGQQTHRSWTALIRWSTHNTGTNSGQTQNAYGKDYKGDRALSPFGSGNILLVPSFKDSHERDLVLEVTKALVKSRLTRTPAARLLSPLLEKFKDVISQEKLGKLVYLLSTGINAKASRTEIRKSAHFLEAMLFVAKALDVDTTTGIKLETEGLETFRSAVKHKTTLGKYSVGDQIDSDDKKLLKTEQKSKHLQAVRSVEYKRPKYKTKEHLSSLHPKLKPAAFKSEALGIKDEQAKLIFNHLCEREILIQGKKTAYPNPLISFHSRNAYFFQEDTTAFFKKMDEKLGLAEGSSQTFALCKLREAKPIYLQAHHITHLIEDISLAYTGKPSLYAGDKFRMKGEQRFEFTPRLGEKPQGVSRLWQSDGTAVNFDRILDEAYRLLVDIQEKAFAHSMPSDAMLLHSVAVDSEEKISLTPINISDLKKLSDKETPLDKKLEIYKTFLDHANRVKFPFSPVSDLLKLYVNLALNLSLARPGLNLNEFEGMEHVFSFDASGVMSSFNGATLPG